MVPSPLIGENIEELGTRFPDMSEVYDKDLQALIKETAKAPSNIIMQTTDEADKLKKYKDLLDSGVITQEEFDAKKKQLLDL